jgi:hypothetical protein
MLTGDIYPRDQLPPGNIADVVAEPGEFASAVEAWAERRQACTVARVVGWAGDADGPQLSNCLMHSAIPERAKPSAGAGTCQWRRYAGSCCSRLALNALYGRSPSAVLESGHRRQERTV